MAWTSVGSVTVGPTSGLVVVGPLEVPLQGGVELCVRQTTPSPGFRFGYGIASFVNSEGRPLGSTKFWASDVWESFRLGEGLSTSTGIGSLVIEPRSWNLRWVKAGWPWGLEFKADSPTALPNDRYQAPGLVTATDRLLRLVRVGTQARVRF
jgi:hypothetical protein